MRTTLVGLVLLLTPINGFNQNKNGAATANGQCSIAISGNNNTAPSAKEMADTCGIGKEQLDKIVALLNGVLTKRDLKQLNAKLDELIEVATRPAQICSNNIFTACVAGDNYGTVIGPVFGARNAPPAVAGLVATAIPAVAATPPPQYSDDPKIRDQQGRDYKVLLRSGQIHGASNPGLSLSFHVEGAFQNPMFLIRCDRPCTGIGAQVFRNGSGGTRGNNSFLSTDDPKTLILVLGDFVVLTHDLTVSVSVLSADKDPLASATIDSYIQ